jgi:hypothetical protein
MALKKLNPRRWKDVVVAGQGYFEKLLIKQPEKQRGCSPIADLWSLPVQWPVLSVVYRLTFVHSCLIVNREKGYGMMVRVP